MITKTINNYKKNEDGFSLLELVVAVGILLVLTTGGLLAYSGITKNARVSSTQAAASDVLTVAITYDNEGKNYKKAEEEWMNSANKDNKDNPIVNVSSSKDDNGEICVVAEMKDYNIKSNKGVGCEVPENNNNIKYANKWVNIELVVDIERPDLAGDSVDVIVEVEGEIVDSYFANIDDKGNNSQLAYNYVQLDENGNTPNHIVKITTSKGVIEQTVSGSSFKHHGYGETFRTEVVFDGGEPVE